MRIVLQNTESDCLIACASMIMNYYHCYVPAYLLLEKIEMSKSGSDVLQLREALASYNFQVNGYRVEQEQIHNKMLPVIAYVNNNHFIVLEKAGKNKVIAIDPAIGKTSYTQEEFRKIYSGVLVKVEPLQDKAFVPEMKDSTIKDAISFMKDKKMKWIFVGILLSSVFLQIVAMCYSSVYSIIVKNKSYLQVFTIIGFAMILLIIGNMVQGGLKKSFNVRYEKIYGNPLMEKLVRKSYKFFSFRSNGDLIYRINVRGSIKDSIVMQLIPAMIAFCTIIFVIVVLLKSNLISGIIFISFCILYFLIYTIICRLNYMANNKYIQKVIKLNTTSENIIRSIETIKVLNVTEKFVDRWENENEKQADLYGDIVILRSFQAVLSNVFTYIVPIIISIISMLVNQNSDMIEEIALLPLLYLVVQNVVIDAEAINSIVSVMPSLAKLQEVSDIQFMQDKPRVFEQLPDDILMELKNFSYHYGNVICLKDVNMKIEKGKKYAVIGLSGSGKSTLLKNFAHLLCDYEGEIIYNKQYPEKPVYLDQASSIIDGTIIENVLFGQEQDEKKLQRVCEITGLDTVVQKLRAGWQTEISQGMGLSKGQEQRVCLARCLLKEADIYLLDEATSNIDVIDEEKIVQNIFEKNEWMRQKTILFSTHKLSIIKYVDEVIYVADHTIMVGKHEELYNNISEYRKLFELN